MRASLGTVLALVGCSLAALPHLSVLGTTVGPFDIGPYKNIVLTIAAANTYNSTGNLVSGKFARHAKPVTELEAPSSQFAKRANQKIVLSLESTCRTTSTVNAYVTAYDQSGRFMMLKPSGEWYVVPVTAASPNTQIDPKLITLSVANAKFTDYTIPSYAIGGRIWYAVNGTLPFFTNGQGGKAQLVGPSPSNPQDASYNIAWGFAELTNDDSGLYINLSAVDFVGVPALMNVKSTSGSTKEVAGLQYDALPKVCASLQDQGNRDRWPWGNLCRYSNTNSLVRVVSPNLLISGGFNANNAFNNYFEGYVSSVYQKYTSQDLTLNGSGQNGGKVVCRVSNNQIQCNNGDGTPYAKPATKDIFSCASGSFAADVGNDIHKAGVAILCAAFNRGTLLLNGGDVQPSLPVSSYYTINPTNYYSKWVHNYTISPIYAFPYDDVNPSGGRDQSGTIREPNPDTIRFVIGGFQFNAPGQSC